MGKKSGLFYGAMQAGVADAHKKEEKKKDKKEKLRKEIADKDYRE